MNATEQRVGAVSQGALFTDEVRAGPSNGVRWPPTLHRLEQLLRRPGVTDVLINGKSATWVVAGSRMTTVDIGMDDEATIRWAAIWLINHGGKHLDDSTPCADVVVDGFRVHAILPPISGTCATLSIRVPATSAPTLEMLVNAGSLSVRQSNWLRAQVTQRKNFLICGGTGSGKTTLLASLMSTVAPDQRLITIEDVPELNILHKHVVALRTRQANIEGTGALDAAQLVREALRMRPDRIVLGECRGAEFLELLTALNTGHAGGAGTLHANGLDDVISRLYILGALSGIDQSLVDLLSSSAFDLVIEMSVVGGRRMVRAVGSVELGGAGSLVVRELPW